jgi:hypothetical protein
VAVYCDDCMTPGSPNDEAGYTEGGGWQCPAHRPDEWERRVRGYEAEGMTRSDAQAVADAEDAKAGRQRHP